MNTETFFEHPTRKWLTPIKYDPISDHMIIAGGSVLRCIMKCDEGIHDVDAYITAEDEDMNAVEMMNIARRVIMRCIELLKPEHIIATRTTTTLYKTKEDAPFQIVMQLNNDYNEVIHSFDLVNSRVALIGKYYWNLRVSPDAQDALNLHNQNRKKYIGVVSKLVSCRTPDRIRKYAKLLNTDCVKFDDWKSLNFTEETLKDYIKMRSPDQNLEDYTYYSSFDKVKELEKYMMNVCDEPYPTPDVDDACLVAGSVFKHIDKEFESMKPDTLRTRLDMWHGFRLKRNWWMYQHLNDEEKEKIRMELERDGYDVEYTA